MTTIQHDLVLATTPQALFAALTTPEGIRGWWAKDSDVGDGVGASHELRFVKDDRTVAMGFEVTEASPNRVVWRCTENGNPIWPGTTLTWAFEADGEKTALTFKHEGFAESASPPYAMTVDGWKHFMASLAAYAQTGTGEPW
ncbi:MAG: SRPBCC domain-containing protein [Myxococcota bacterium]